MTDEQTNLSVELFNACAARAWELARTEAGRLGHAHLCTEHLLIALAAEAGAATRRVLENLGLSADRLREQVLFIRGRGDNPPPDPAAIAPAPRLMRALESARAEATRRGHEQIGTIHLLLGILREREGLAVMLLQVPGVGLERAGTEIVRAIRDGVRDEVEVPAQSA